ncbi:MAG: 2Fe-2S iron-sulfur cluster binding domain-containing protein [Magnetococcales bacterium]|nr:2Fe-2S iron-sulfur cluster binding domain-containing protein [Magnetococcales bacterium]
MTTSEALTAFLQDHQSALEGVMGTHPFRVAGWLLVIGIAIQVSLAIVGQARRVIMQEKRQRIEIKLLETRLEKATTMHRLETERRLHSWSGVRKFRIKRKVQEVPGVWSLYLVPHDGQPLPPFLPGQYLTFVVRIPGREKPVTRCYSLSSHPQLLDHYRITVKQIAAPAETPGSPSGEVSTYLCTRTQEGDILDVKPVSGHFTLDPEGTRPVVLIGGGIGITPLLTKMWSLCGTGDSREVWLFHGVRNSQEHLLKLEIEAAAATCDRLHLHFCYSRPLPGDQPGKNFHHVGHVDMALLKATLPSNNYEFHICGTSAMMQDLVTGLAQWGVPDAHVHYEAFGPSSISRTPSAPTPNAEPLTIFFSRSDKRVTWIPDADSILELAEKNNVPLDGGCRAGNCGTCAVALKSGEVSYVHDPGLTPEQGTCLACIAVPKGDLVIDA